MAKQLRRLTFPGPEYPDAWVELPPEWLGAHMLRRDAAVQAAAKYQNVLLTEAAVALAIAESWGGIPGIEGADPAQWDFAAVPITLLRWLEAEVFTDFIKAFVVPKNSSPASGTG